MHITKDTTPYERWEHAVLCYTQGFSADAVTTITERLVAAEASGKTSCVWHETHAYTIETRRPNPCRHCGTHVEPRQGNRHNLCAARAERGLPTPALDDTTTRCPCMPCNRK